MPWQNFRWMSTYDLRSIYAFLQAIPPVKNVVQADMNRPAIPPTPFTGNYDEGDVTRPLPAEFDAQNNPIPDPNWVLRGSAEVPIAITYPTSPSDSELFGRGAYIVNAIAGCNGCHSNPERSSGGDGGLPAGRINTSQYLGGGQIFNTPPPLQPIVHTVRSMSANLSGKSLGYFNSGTISFDQWDLEITQGVHADVPPPRPPLAWPMPAATFRNMTIDDLEAVYFYVRYVSVNGQATITADKPTQDAARYCTAPADCITAIGETCNTATKECVGGPCANDSECGACQTCSPNADGGPGTRQAPADPSACTGL
jgi:hypothetical protein